MLQITSPLHPRHLPKIEQLPSGRGSWTHVVAWPPLQVGHRHIWKLTCYSLYFMMGGRHGRSYFILSFSSYIEFVSTSGSLKYTSNINTSTAMVTKSICCIRSIAHLFITRAQKYGSNSHIYEKCHNVLSQVFCCLGVNCYSLLRLGFG